WFPVGALHVPHGAVNACTTLVVRWDAMDGARGLPLSVMMMEAALTYAAMWTARKAEASPVVQALFAGLSLLALDALLDPAVAAIHDCGTGALAASTRSGIGLWRWYSIGAPSAEWFGIPLFNFAAWFAGPALLVSFANLARRGV